MSILDGYIGAGFQCKDCGKALKDGDGWYCLQCAPRLPEDTHVVCIKCRENMSGALRLDRKIMKSICFSCIRERNEKASV